MSDLEIGFWVAVAFFINFFGNALIVNFSIKRITDKHFINNLINAINLNKKDKNE